MYYVDLYVKPYVKGGKSLLSDASETNDTTWIERLKQQLDLMSFSIETAQTTADITRIATKFVRAINTFNYHNVKMQTAIVGIDPISEDVAIRAYVKGKIAENVSLIKTMQSNYLNSLQDAIYRSITKGSGITQITEEITKRTGMSARHAKMIATDQTGSIIGQLQAYRSQKAGAKYYIWQSMEDNRVRPRHQTLDETKQRYGDPNGGDDGQLPGEPISCRCLQVPVFDDD